MVCPHLQNPFPPFSPSLISRTVSVDVKHHVYSVHTDQCLLLRIMLTDFLHLLHILVLCRSLWIERGIYNDGHMPWWGLERIDLIINMKWVGTNSEWTRTKFMVAILRLLGCQQLMPAVRVCSSLMADEGKYVHCVTHSRQGNELQFTKK